MKKIQKIFFIFPTILLSFLVFSNISSAQVDIGGGGPTDTSDTGTITCPAGESCLDFKLNNPLDDEIDSIPILVEKILEIVVVVAVPIITLMIIYTGFLFVQARGNDTKLKDAKKALGYTLLGAAIIIGAWTIAQIIGSTVDCLKPGVVC